MIKTKYVTLIILCEACGGDEEKPYIKNFDKLPCDKCGQIKSKVTFKEN